MCWIIQFYFVKEVCYVKGLGIENKLKESYWVFYRMYSIVQSEQVCSQGEYVLIGGVGVGLLNEEFVFCYGWFKKFFFSQCEFIIQ